MNEDVKNNLRRILRKEKFILCNYRGMELWVGSNYEGCYVEFSTDGILVDTDSRKVLGHFKNLVKSWIKEANNKKK